MLTGFRFLDPVNINTLVKGLQTEVEVGRPYTFLSRLPIVNAEDDEIFGRYSGQIYAADIIADDQEAVIYESGGFETYRAGAIPKIKMGARVGEGRLRRLIALAEKVTLSDNEQDLITGWENQLARQLVEGLRVRQNAMACAMMINSASYNRLGMRIDGGWIADTTVAAALNTALVGAAQWDNPATAVPVSNLETVIKTASDSYGQPYDTVTMSRLAFERLTRSDEFANRASFLYRYTLPAGTIQTVGLQSQIELFQAMTGLRLEIENSTYRTRNVNGADELQRVLPENIVLFSNSADYGNPDVMDFANGTIIESLVAPIFNAAIGVDLGGEQFGPFSYYTGKQDLNPPDLSAWAVVRGLPRRHVQTATATLTVW